MTKIKTFKNGAWTTFERTPFAGHYVVRVYSPSGQLLDKVVCDDRANARDYLRSFNGIARNS
jgi:hypothetical protein